MELEQLYNLDHSKLYKLWFYHGEIRTARIFVDFKEKSAYWYHLTDQTKDKEIKEIGIKFNPRTLAKIEVVQKDEPNLGSTYVIRNGPKARKMIILGAGASYDHIFNLNLNDTRLINRLPLTNQLFDESYLEILKEFPGAFDLSTEILYSRNLEQFFQEKWTKVLDVHNMPLLKKLINAQFYIFYLFEHLSHENKNHQKSNYYNLISMAYDYILKRENEYIPIVTFNYDTLLEDSINRVTEFQFNKIGDYGCLDRIQLPLFKPHGSSNWIREFKAGFIDINRLKNGFTLLEFSKYISKQNYNLAEINGNLVENIKLRKLTDDLNISPGFMPSLLLPFKDKDDLLMPKDHTSVLKHLLRQIEEILIIGWKGAESKFQNLLSTNIKDKPVKITLIDPGENAIIEFAKNYKDVLPNLNFCDFTNGKQLKTFSNYIQFCRDGNEPHFFSD